MRLGKIYPGSRGFRLPNRECKPAGQAPGEHVLHRDEKAFDLRNVSELSTERLDDGVFDGKTMAR